jgi:hypothetical protein
MIATLILCFLLVASFPFWYGRIGGGSGTKPKLEPPPSGEKVCVEETDYMREHHVELLTQWRDSVVRNGIRTYRAKDGKDYAMSLTDTCLRCHSNKQNFCDQCHNYVKVSPKCWDCHVVPKGAK